MNNTVPLENYTELDKAFTDSINRVNSLQKLVQYLISEGDILVEQLDVDCDNVLSHHVLDGEVGTALYKMSFNDCFKSLLLKRQDQLNKRIEYINNIESFKV